MSLGGGVPPVARGEVPDSAMVYPLPPERATFGASERRCPPARLCWFSSTRRLATILLMPKYEPDLGPDQYDAIKHVILDFAQTRAGPFDANDALAVVIASGTSTNAGTVAAILEDLTGAGFLRKLPGGREAGERPQWEYAAITGPGSPGG